MYEVTMPKLSDTMEVGQIIEWRVKEGDEVHEGDVLAEVESDKAVMELECFHDGKLAKIIHGKSAEVRVGEVIAWIAGKGETVEAAGPPAGTPEAKEAARMKEPERKPAAEKARQGKRKEEAKRMAPEEEEEEQQEKGPRAVRPEGEKREAPVRAETRRPGVSPYASRLARERGIDTSELAGSGPGGRIIARDVERASSGKPTARGKAEAAPTAPKEGPTPTAMPAGIRPSPDEELPPIDIRADEATVEEASFRFRTAAARVTASKHVIPHFYLTRSADVTELFARLPELKQKLGVTVTHLVELACFKTLKKHPEVNRSYDRGRIIRWKGVHLGLAVDTDQGLTVAVLVSAEDLGLEELVRRTSALVERARAGKLSGEERRHPTFTISNLGMFDVEHFEPIINPPGSMTLAVSSALDSPVVRRGSVQVGKVMKLTVSCDHRIVDGVLAAKFVHDLASLLEDPDALLDGEL